NRTPTDALRERGPDAKCIRDRGTTRTAVDGDEDPRRAVDGIPPCRGIPRLGAVGDRLKRRLVRARNEGGRAEEQPRQRRKATEEPAACFHTGEHHASFPRFESEEVEPGRFVAIVVR